MITVRIDHTVARVQCVPSYLYSFDLQAILPSHAPDGSLHVHGSAGPWVSFPAQL